MPKVQYNCDNCGKEIFRYTTAAKTHFCDKLCKSKYQEQSFEKRFGVEKAAQMRARIVEVTQGANNPNFGNRWSDEQKLAESIRKKELNQSLSIDERKERYGKSNRGLTRSKEYIANWHSTRQSPEYTSKPLSDETKAKIGAESSKKFTPAYKQYIRSKMESEGHWIPLSQKTRLEIYYKESNWIQRMWDIVESELTNDIGIFNAFTNRKGAVRDHILNRREGFELGVFPELLRHPANCQIVRHSDNVKKRSKSGITLDELFTNILNYDNKWIEQELCITLIENYRKGQRWI